MAKNSTIKKKRGNSEGTVVQLASGRWRAQISLGYKEDGTRNRPSEVFDTEKEAIAWKNKMIARAEIYGTASVIDQSGMFVPKYHTWLMEVKITEVYSRQFKTIMSHYNNWIKNFFARIKEKDITQSMMQGFFNHLEEKNVGAESRKKIKYELHQYFEYVYKDTPMRNPLDGVKTETKKKLEIIDPISMIDDSDYKAVPKELREKFLTCLDTDLHSPFLRPLCYLMYFTGNRVGEALAYQWKDFNFEERYFLVYKSVTIEYEFDKNGNVLGKGKTMLKSPKTKNGIRPLPMIDILFEVMFEWYEQRKALEKVRKVSLTAPDDYVFGTENGELRTEGGTYSIFRRFLKRYDLQGKGIHFHALRQTFSNSLFTNGTDDQTIVDLMGHASISTTKKHYKSVQKFDSIKTTAQKLNEIYRPKDEKYAADSTVGYVPKGYMTESEAITKTARRQTERKQKKPKELKEVLGDLKDVSPEIFQILKEALLK